MSRLRQILFINNPVASFTTAAFIISYFALGPYASLGSIALLLSLLLVYFPILLRHHSSQGVILWLVLTVGRCLAWRNPSLDALSNVASSLFASFILSGGSCLVSLATIYVYNRLRNHTMAHILLFPMLWTTVWCLISHFSLVGHLAQWSPIVAAEPYRWILHLCGPAALDWLTAAWAVVLSQICELWFMDSPEQDDFLNTDEGRHISSYRIFSVLGLVTILLGLTAPSFAQHYPEPVWSNNTTPFGVACILPPKHTQKPHTISFEDYLTESLRHTSSAQIILWPEASVSFRDEDERDGAFRRVYTELKQAPLVGISFTDVSTVNGKSVQRNGFALIATNRTGNSNETEYVKLMYYKRNLVPIAESFSLTHSQDPPNMFTFEFNSPKGIPGPPYKRPISLTASICLDFAMPLPFSNLSSKPALILAPARTWERSIGHIMWQQAVQRAYEMDTMILWCDGGEGGVSGVAGRGFDQVYQVGENSWSRKIGIHYPFDQSLSIYARIGDWGWLAVGWVTAAFYPVIKRLTRKQVDPVPTGNLLSIGKGLVTTETSQFASTLSFPARLARSSRKLKHVPSTNTLCTDDFQLISHADLPISLDDSSQIVTSFLVDPDPVSSSFARFWKPLKAQQKQASSNRFRSFLHSTDPILDQFPNPPTYIPNSSTLSLRSPAVAAQQAGDSPTDRRKFTFRLSLPRPFRLHRKKNTPEERVPDPQSLENLRIPPSPSSAAQTLVEDPQDIYQVVNPCDLTASPSFSPNLDLLSGSTRTSFIPPSPSWLSRNVLDLEPPPSPPPLPIPPRLVNTSSESPCLSPLETAVDWFKEGQTSSETSISRKTSIVSLKSPAVVRSESLSKPLLFKQVGSSDVSDVSSLAPGASAISNISLRTHIFPPSPSKAGAKPELVPPTLLRHTSQRDPIPPTQEFWDILGGIYNDFSAMAYTGKRTDIVDFGGEFDYSDHQWFQDRPERPPPAPQQPATPYVPLPGVIEQNEAFEFALSAAPNVLYGRYKQYGELGVLAWCSEFGELIDGLKDLGFNGNMFVSTRTQALKTCEELLKLKLDIKMQIIIMYLSSQVSRLRRFLDGDRAWDDYPESQFPLEPRSYT